MLFRDLLKNGKGIKFIINAQNPQDTSLRFRWGTHDSVTPYFEECYKDVLDTHIRLEPQEEPTDLPVVSLLDKVNPTDLSKIMDILSGREGGIQRRLLTGCLLPDN